MIPSNLKYAIIEFLTVPFIIIGYMIFVIGILAMVLSAIVLMIGDSIVESIKLFLKDVQNG